MHRVCFPACSCVIRENLVSLNVKSLFSQTVSANNTLPCSARCSLCSALILPYCAANSEFHTFSLIATSLFVSLHRSPSVSTPKTRGNVLNPPLRAFLIQHQQSSSVCRTIPKHNLHLRLEHIAFVYTAAKYCSINNRLQTQNQAFSFR